MSIQSFLTQYGEDALSNHYSVVLSLPILLGGAVLSNSITLRIVSVDIPDQAIGTYNIQKNGQSAAMPSGMEASDKTFTFTYRVGAYWPQYKIIAKWLGLLHNPSSGFMSPIAGLRASVTIHALDRQGINISGVKWTMYGAFPTSQRGVSFEEDGGNPIMINVAMSFTECNYPGTIPIV